MEFAELANKSTQLPGTESRIFSAGAIFSALLMLTIPFSTSVAIGLTFLIIACWFLSGQYRTLPVTLRNNPVALTAMILYGLLLIGMLYGNATTEESLLMLRKYRELLIIVILIPFMQNPKYRYWTLNAFIAGSVLTLLGSYLQDFGLLPLHRLGTPTIKSHITHSLFMAVFAYFCACKTAEQKKRRNIWLGLCLLTTINLFFVVQGRTGQLIFILLMLLFFFQRFNSKSALVLTLTLLICLVSALGLSGKTKRFEEAITNSTQYFEGQRKLDTSMGQRLYFWQNSIRLVSARPILGFGTGSFSKEFQRITREQGLPANNPHNDFLMISVQLGLVGLFAYLLFLYSQWHYSHYLPYDQRCFAQGIFISLVINSLLNSTFLDHTEGHWYASMIALAFGTLSINKNHKRANADQQKNSV